MSSMVCVVTQCFTFLLVHEINASSYNSFLPFFSFMLAHFNYLQQRQGKIQSCHWPNVFRVSDEIYPLEQLKCQSRRTCGPGTTSKRRHYYLGHDKFGGYDRQICQLNNVGMMLSVIFHFQLTKRIPDILINTNKKCIQHYI